MARLLLCCRALSWVQAIPWLFLIAKLNIVKSWTSAPELNCLYCSVDRTVPGMGLPYQSLTILKCLCCSMDQGLLPIDSSGAGTLVLIVTDFESIDIGFSVPPQTLATPRNSSFIFSCISVHSVWWRWVLRCSPPQWFLVVKQGNELPSLEGIAWGYTRCKVCWDKAEGYVEEQRNQKCTCVHVIILWPVWTPTKSLYSSNVDKMAQNRSRELAVDKGI